MYHGTRTSRTHEDAHDAPSCEAPCSHAGSIEHVHFDIAAASPRVFRRWARMRAISALVGAEHQAGTLVPARGPRACDRTP